MKNVGIETHSFACKGLQTTSAMFDQSSRVSCNLPASVALFDWLTPLAVKGYVRNHLTQSVCGVYMVLLTSRSFGP